MALEMSKRVEKVALQLKKLNIPDTLKAQVKFELDDSGSAVHMYMNGTMQELTERLMAVALRMDADGKLEVTSFSDKAHKHGDVTEQEIPNYIQNRFIPEAKQAGTWQGGTNYAKAIAASIESPVSKAKGFLGKLFGAKAEKNYPSFHIFVSDGQDMGDRAKFIDLLKQATNDYFMLVGVGPKTYFKLMEDAGDLLPNVGFVNFSDLSISDDTMYEMLLQKEALDWLLARQPS